MVTKFLPRAKSTLTVFTPTFNRAYSLHLCYESLLRQTLNDFEWIVIDDGSTDNTKELVNSWITENKIIIHYHYKENEGMHTAHNLAYRFIDTELNVCIDSDDYLADNAIELIIRKWKEEGSNKYAGIIGLNAKFNRNIIGSEFTTNSTTLSNFYQAGGRGDKKLVYRTDIMKELPEYPIFEGEKYVGLNYKYLLADLQYELLTMNKIICYVDYQTDGSSMNMYRQYFRNPRGFAFIRKESMKHHPSAKRRFMEAIHYVSSSIICRNYKFIQESPRKILTITAIPLGLLLYLYLKYKQNKFMNVK